MHCNLRPPDTEPVIFLFNWDACAKTEDIIIIIGGEHD